MPIPNDVVIELNRLLYKFLWNGTDKVTRLYIYIKKKYWVLEVWFENDRPGMYDSKYLRLAWLKRIFSENVRGKIICDIFWLNQENFSFSTAALTSIQFINSLFYSELLKWWSEFRENFASTKDWCNIIWNNKEIRINSSQIFYKNFFDYGI